MKRKGTQMERQFESRFASVVLLFRIAGIPFKIKKLSTLYTIYMITVIFCTSTTFVGMIVDVYVHRDNLRHAATNIRGSITATNMIWIWFYCRLVTKLAVTFLSSPLNIKQSFRFREMFAIYRNLLKIKSFKTCGKLKQTPFICRRVHKTKD